MMKEYGENMSNFNPKKLSVRLIPPATSAQPIQGRKYTLTHSDLTAELFLDIGYQYNDQSINWKMRDEVLAEWKKKQGNLYLIGWVYVDGGEFDKQTANKRFSIFIKEMDTALKGIVYGDLPLYTNYPELLDAPIYVHYESCYPQYRMIANYGSPRWFIYNIEQEFL